MDLVRQFISSPRLSSARIVPSAPTRVEQFAQPNINQLHTHGERHGEVEVALWDLQVCAFGDQRDADQDQ